MNAIETLRRMAMAPRLAHQKVAYTIDWPALLAEVEAMQRTLVNGYAIIDRMASELQRLQAIVDKLKTTDGVPIDPDMALWSRVPVGVIDNSDGFKQTHFVVTSHAVPARLMSLYGIIKNGYSTREAAEQAARKDGNL